MRRPRPAPGLVLWSGPRPRRQPADDRRAALLYLLEPLEARVLLSAGDLDPTFGQGGKVFTDITAVEDVRAVAVQKDGKILVAGAVVGPHPQIYSGTFASEPPPEADANWLLARYNPDGSLDATFGTNGIINPNLNPGDYDGAFSIAIQPDGKIVVGGTHIVRYNPDGTLDATFGNNGIVDAGAWRLTLQPDGKIIAAGAPEVAYGNGGEFSLRRYNADGSLDATFNTSESRPAIPGTDRDMQRIHSVTVQPDGKILLGGTTDYWFEPGDKDFYFRSDYVVARLNADGTVDASFGNGGFVLTQLPGNQVRGEITSVKVQPDGKIVAAGSYDSRGDWTGSKTAIFRWNADGSVDTSFGGGDGHTLANTHGTVPELALQGNGKIVAAIGVTSLFTVLRLDANGDLDATFGGGDGIVAERYGNNPYDWSRAVAIQGDGKIVAAGYAGAAGGIGSDILLARYEGDGATAAPPPQSGQVAQESVATPQPAPPRTPAPPWTPIDPGIGDGTGSTGGGVIGEPTPDIGGETGGGGTGTGGTEGDDTNGEGTGTGGSPAGAPTAATPFSVATVASTADGAGVLGEDDDLLSRSEDRILT